MGYIEIIDDENNMVTIDQRWYHRLLAAKDKLDLVGKGWISVGERHPKAFEILEGIDMPNRTVHRCHLVCGTFQDTKTSKEVKITHWKYATELP
jgi:hypothetical protein